MLTLKATDNKARRGLLLTPHGKAQTPVFMPVGTSGAVWPAAGLVNLAREAGGTAILVNAEAAENTARFHRFLQGKSAEILPVLLGADRSASR